MSFNIISFVWHVVNGLILYFALRHFLYKPVRRFMDERAQRIQNQLDEAEQAQRAAQAELDKQHALTLKAQEQLNLAAKDGADKGRARAQELIEQAQDEARQESTGHGARGSAPAYRGIGHRHCFQAVEPGIDRTG